MAVSTKRFLLLGESPNEATEGHPELWLRPYASGIRHSAYRLLEYTGYEMVTFLDLFERDYLVHRCLPRTDEGKNSLRDEGRQQSVNVIQQMETKELGALIVLGRRAANCFRWWERDPGDQKVPWPRLEYLEWYDATPHPRRSGMEPVSAVVVPHPSGLNRWWNDAENRKRARWFFDRLLECSP